MVVKLSDTCVHYLWHDGEYSICGKLPNDPVHSASESDYPVYHQFHKEVLCSSCHKPCDGYSGHEASECISNLNEDVSHLTDLLRDLKLLLDKNHDIIEEFLE